MSFFSQSSHVLRTLVLVILEDLQLHVDDLSLVLDCAYLFVKNHQPINPFLRYRDHRLRGFIRVVDNNCTILFTLIFLKDSHHIDFRMFNDSFNLLFMDALPTVILFVLVLVNAILVVDVPTVENYCFAAVLVEVLFANWTQSLTVNTSLHFDKYLFDVLYEDKLINGWYIVKQSLLTFKFFVTFNKMLFYQRYIYFVLGFDPLVEECQIPFLKYL